GLLAGQPVPLPRKQSFRLIAAHLPGADRHTSLFEGVDPKSLTDARRTLPPLANLCPELLKALQEQANLEAMVEQPIGTLTPARILANVGQMLEKMPDGQAAPAAHALASLYV